MLYVTNNTKLENKYDALLKITPHCSILQSLNVFIFACLWHF